MSGLFVISGCKLLQQAHHQQIYDPTEIDTYQLPALIDGLDTVKSFRQSRGEETWFWTQLENNTYLPSENLVIQIISPSPFKQPPKMFSFTVPTQKGQYFHNFIGPYQQWIKVMETGERCFISRQNSRQDNYWLTIFTNVCTSDQEQKFSWINKFKPSLLLEGF
ncbi:hypothetical protein [Candidatus Enterovibrio escicola]|uniref:hypothetical protein n=1 Tax=Candidatus Enterovibrio escicola TaxID=1927127 RepID=UPI001CC267B8|nr:hypothetical protein [Candidatus Enterovibrio escacola]